MSNLLYVSTRGGGEPVSSSYAILHGIAPDGGLYVPQTFPVLDVPLAELCKMSYQEVGYQVMKLFFTDYTEEELRSCIQAAYDDKFDDPQIAPLKMVGAVPVLELFHGKTMAFKDMALSILPYLMTTAAHKQDLEEEIVILTATSGDTGKAAMEGFSNVPGVRIIVFYPKDGVSSIQKRQMVTQQGDNTHVVALEGNFDQAQSAVKAIFTDPNENRRMHASGYSFSSANSINIGRLVPQVVYYVWAYLQLVNEGRIEAGSRVDFTVPTGNFGNILAGLYAKKLGLPIGTLVCASNKNHVLTDFFRTGLYDVNREFYLTTSPSMDILISSNLERLLYMLLGENAEEVKILMTGLRQRGSYHVAAELPGKAGIEAFYAEEEEVKETIARIYRESGYVSDPHTAVAFACAEKFRQSCGSNHPMVVVSTASPYKFPDTILQALGAEIPENDEEKAELLSEKSGVPVPAPMRNLFGMPVRHYRSCRPEDAAKEVHSILGL